MKSRAMHRRAFLKSTVAAGTLVAAPRVLDAAEPKTAGGSKRIKVGVIGCGSVSTTFKWPIIS